MPRVTCACKVTKQKGGRRYEGALADADQKNWRDMTWVSKHYIYTSGTGARIDYLRNQKTGKDVTVSRAGCEKKGKD